MTREEAEIRIRAVFNNYFYFAGDREADEVIEVLRQEPCEDAISRQAVINVLKDKWNMFTDANDAMQESIDTIEALEPKKGHWIEEKSKVYKCSNCGRYALEWGGQLMMSRYCPNCGAKMAESEDYE